MFGRDPVLPLNTLLEPKIRYMGNDINILSLEAMKNLYEIAATNLKLAQEKGDPQEQPLSTKLQPGDTVLIENHVKGPFDTIFTEKYSLLSLGIMAHTKQTPRNPKIDRPTAAMGSDV